MVDRQTRCILGWKVAWERSAETIQQMVDEAPKAKEYFSDGWDASAMFWYHLGYYQVSDGKSDTYSVEADQIFALFLALSICLRVRLAVIRVLIQFQTTP